MQRFSKFPFALRLLLLLLLLLTCVAIGIFVSVRSPTPAPFIVLHQPVHMPIALRDRFNRWIPQTRSWAWVWRVEDTVFGRRKPVNVYAEVVSLADSSRAALSSLALSAPSFSHTNGLEVWLLGADQLKALRDLLKQAAGADPPLRFRMTTADGIECQLFRGQQLALGRSTNQVGCALDCCARVHSESTDLTACMTLSDLVTNEPAALVGSSPLISIRTNLDTALRLQIPRGSGVFLVDQSSGDSTRKPVGVIIDPLQPKK